MKNKYDIIAKGLTKRFNGFTAVDTISFSVKSGEIFAFLGPNGAGKTTTIKMLITLLPPTSGQISVGGYDPVSEKNAVRKSIGIVFQDQSLDEELTAYENMDFHGALYGMPSPLRKKRITELLKTVDLEERKHSIVKTFSGGMRRRLEIARSLIHHPKILFLDEPTIGLDPQTRNQIWDYIRKMNRNEGSTIFFTTHYMEEAEKIAQTIAIIDKGKIIAQGNASNLKRKTKTSSLEAAFLKLTGSAIRDEAADSLFGMRMRSRMWRGRQN